jgi:hypothetical protein
MENLKNETKNIKAIEEQLKAGRRLTVISVLHSVGTLELRYYIAKLRKTMPIADQWQSKNGKRFKEYYLAK